MKHILIIAFSLLIVLGFTACSKEESTEKNPETPVEPGKDSPEVPDAPVDNPSSDEEAQSGKTLIVYFSRTGYNYPNQWLEIGHTARIAGYIAELTGCDKFEIIPEVPYPDNYQETVAIAREEYDNNARPTIRNKIENIDKYDTIFIGSPIWHGAVPMIIHTFYESYNLSSKTLVPFTTHAGSGLGDSERVARSYYPNNTILSGLAVQGTNSANARDDVERWLKRIGVIK